MVFTGTKKWSYFGTVHTFMVLQTSAELEYPLLVGQVLFILLPQLPFSPSPLRKFRGRQRLPDAVVNNIAVFN